MLPVVLGAAIVMLDRSATGPVRRAEAFLVPLFLVGVGGSGIAGFITHFFISDPMARAIGWETGSPFQLEVGFAHLALGLLGAIASERRGGFREATVLAAAVFGVGTAVAHVMHGAATDTLGTGNWLLWVVDLVRPALLVWFLMALKRGEEVEPPTILLRGWMIPLRRGSVVAATVAAMAFALGFATGQPVVLAAVAIAVGAVVIWWFVSRATTHRVSAS